MRDGTILRTGPGNFHPLIKKLNSQVSVVVIDSVAGWFHVNVIGDNDNSTGWISSNATTTVVPRDATVIPGNTSGLSVGVGKTALSAMIKGFSDKLRCNSDNVVVPFDGVSDINSVHQFRNSFEVSDIGKPVTSSQVCESLVTEILAAAPVLASRVVEQWGGRQREYESYCNQVLLWIADRAGATEMLPYVLVCREGKSAVCLPGGIIVMGGDLFNMIEDESELAGVLGHELVHAVFRHGQETVEDEMKRVVCDLHILELGQEVGTFDDFDLSELNDFQDASIQHVRRIRNIDHELMADSISTVWLVRCGYDVTGLKRFLGRFSGTIQPDYDDQAELPLAWITSRDEIEVRNDRLQTQIPKLIRRGAKADPVLRFQRRFNATKSSVE
ncbi:MAG: M48 family metalloprotease [Candidatus Electryoneaceae bacterium]|nr:M48 family metalloprotease [Candidatus Electryoneaceae bacterium]